MRVCTLFCLFSSSDGQNECVSSLCFRLLVKFPQLLYIFTEISLTVLEGQKKALWSNGSFDIIIRKMNTSPDKIASLSSCESSAHNRNKFVKQCDLCN